MAKKIQIPKRRKEKNKGFHIFFPIKISTIIVFSITLIVMMLIMFAINNKIVSELRHDLTSFFISNLSSFKEAENTQEYTELAKKLNYDLGDSHIIRYIVITDNNQNEVFSTFAPNQPYTFIQTQNKSLFKLNENENFDFLVEQIENIEIKKGEKEYYIGVLKSKVIEDFIDDMKLIISIFICFAVLVGIIVAVIFSQTITKPLEQVEDSISKIGRGDLSNKLDYSLYNEVNKLVQAYNIMTNSLQRLYSSLEAQVNDRTKKLKNAYTELQSTQAMMVHSEKMKSLGELVAGIMHEINNPINFLYGNMTHLSNYSQDLISIVDKYSELDSKLSPEDKKAVEDLKKEIDYDFLKTDMPDLIKSCKEGADRAKNIIQDLKSFSRTGEAAITDVNIVSEIDTTLNILHNKIKHKVTVHKEYIDYVPKIEAFGGQLNQVFMNILDNAVSAIKEKGDVWIRINTDEMYKKLIIEIEDNGEGMDADVIAKVFDPFFTTKPVGQGTGLGMSITHKIVKNHQGDIDVTSVKGKGTKFTVTLPINLDRELLTDRIAEKGADA